MKQLNMANNIKCTLIIWAFLLTLFFEIINQHKMEIEGFLYAIFFAHLSLNLLIELWKSISIISSCYLDYFLFAKL